jgi:hypothetical protein
MYKNNTLALYKICRIESLYYVCAKVDLVINKLIIVINIMNIYIYYNQNIICIEFHQYQI